MFSPKKCEHKFYEQKCLSVMNQSNAKFITTWELWENLFK